MARTKNKPRRQSDAVLQAQRPEGRYTVLSLRVNSEELTLLKKVAPDEMSMNQWLRELVLNAIGR